MGLVSSSELEAEILSLKARFWTQKLRGGHSVSGVEGYPDTGCPLDPDPGLGGMVSLGLFSPKASYFLALILIP